MKIFFFLSILINIFLGVLVVKKLFSSYKKHSKNQVKTTSIIVIVFSIIFLGTVIMFYFNYYLNGFYTNQIIYLITCFSIVIFYYFSNFNIKNRDSIKAWSYTISMGYILLISLSISINGFVEIKNRVIYETKEFRLEKPDVDLLRIDYEYPYLFVKKGWFERKYVSRSLFDDFRVNNGVEVEGAITYIKKRFLRIKKIEIIPFNGGYCVKVNFENSKYIETDYYLDK